MLVSLGFSIHPYSLLCCFVNCFSISLSFVSTFIAHPTGCWFSEGHFWTLTSLGELGILQLWKSPPAPHTHPTLMYPEVTNPTSLEVCTPIPTCPIRKGATCPTQNPWHRAQYRATYPATSVPALAESACLALRGHWRRAIIKGRTTIGMKVYNYCDRVIN